MATAVTNSALPPDATSPALDLALTNDIRALKPAVEIPSGWAWLWWVLAVAIAAALAWLVWRHLLKKRRRPSPQQFRETPLPAADVEALERLRAALAFIHEPDRFCTAVSDAVRHYLERRFSLRAPERTTEEFIEDLQRSPKFSYEQKSSLGEFLSRCDLVKFARYEPGEKELRQLHAAACRLVEETRPVAPAPSPQTREERA